jgi:phosphatidylethanolamine/phosphatidyl-N-methylethanolamine N-methyltransferase
LSTLIYLRNVMKDKNIASITPTSSFGVKKVCSKIDFSKDNIIVEYGPAAGVFSKYLLKHLTADSKLLLIERNANFAALLQQQIKDPRVIISHDDAENVQKILQQHSIPEVDYVISGIPFSFFTMELRDDIVRQTHGVLCREGKFLPYQTFFQKDAHLKVHMEKYFPQVQDEFFILNAPPMRLYEAVK